MAVLAALTICGCSQDARKDYGAAGSNAANAAKETGKAIDADASAVGRSISDAANSSSSTNDQTSSRVKQAILDSPNIEATDLVVNTVDRTVTLSGSVQTEEQNQEAEHIARRLLGPVYTVDDQLKVSGR